MASPVLADVPIPLGSPNSKPPRARLAAPPVACEDSVAVRRYAARAVRRHDSSLLDVPPQQRMRSVAAYQAANIQSVMEEQGKCGRCMLQWSYCMCARLARLRDEVLEHRTADRIRFVAWMHYRERQRSTNTGKLLEHVLPQSEVLTFDVEADERRFQDLIAIHKGRAFVLYPCDGALTPQQLLVEIGELVSESNVAGVDAASADQSTSPSACLNTSMLAVLVDGTWRQARRMQKYFDALPKVILEPRRLSQFHWRRQSREDRISTVEAAALLLEDLGEPVDGAPSVLYRALQALNGSLERQSHYDTFASGPSPPVRTSQRRANNSQKLPKRSPGLRQAQNELLATTSS
eukprot:TRINITY_DN50962_c0_g1_i1.p1 TRINITY_DN50962_c0_g1~~TRINITY_DN50962_c0_g1_i1.p1  ORF type:complete len:349 (-),score=50.06 TRINITY_DN50962_c0_g1_i1:287-1333(-)